MRREREVYIIDLFLFVLSKWRSVLVCSLAIAVFAGGTGLIKSRSVSEGMFSQSDIFSSHSESTLEDVAAKAKATGLNGYYHVLEEYEEYMESSSVIKLNPTKYYTAVLYYMVLAEDNEQAVSIAQVYADSLGTDELFEKIAEVFSEESENISYCDTLETEVLEGGTIRVTFKNNSSDGCAEVAKIIESAMSKNAGKIKRTAAAHKLNLILSEVTANSDWSLLTTKKDIAEDKVAVVNAIASLKNSMSDEDMKYYNGIENSEEAELSETEVSDTVSASEPEMKSVIFKMILGFIVGLAFMALFYMAIYILQRKIRTKRDLENCTGSMVLSVLNIDKGNKNKIAEAIDSLIEHFRFHEAGERDSLEMLLAFVKAYVQRQQLKTIYFTGTLVKEEWLKETLQELIRHFEKEGVCAAIGESILSTSDVFKQCGTSDAVLIFEVAEKSGIDTVAEEVKKLECCGINIMGTVLLR